MSNLKTTGIFPSAVSLLALSLFAMGSVVFLMGDILG